MNRQFPYGSRTSRSACAAALIAALIIPPTPAHAAVSILGGGTLVTFDALPAAADWSTGVMAGASGDITTAAALDASVASLVSTGITLQLGNLGVSPPAASNSAAQFDSIALNIQTRPTGVQYNEVMATLQNNTGSAVSNLAISYNFGMSGTVAESGGLWGHRAYFSLTGLANSWTNITAFNLADNAPAQVLSGSLSLGNWASGATLFVLWVDDNGPGQPDSGFTLDNVSFTPTTLGRNLIYNRSHGVGGAPNGVFTTAGGNYWTDGATNTAFAANDRVAFSQDGDASVDVPAGVTAGSMTVSHATGTYTIGGAGAIASTFTKSNGGSLVLTSANVFGSRAIGGGSVETRANGAIGTSGVLALSGGGILKTSTVPQTLGGQLVIGTGGGKVETITDLSATGLDGAGAFTKSGGGTLTFTGTTGNASGGITLQGGKLSVATDAVLGGNTQGFTFDGGTLEFTNTATLTFIDPTKTRTINATTNGGGIAVTDAVQANGVVIALADKLVGAAGTTLTKSGAGTLRISTAQTTLNSNWVVSGGALEAGVAGIANSLGSGSVTLNTGGILVVPGGGAQTLANPIILAGGAIGTRTGDLAVFAGTMNVTADSNVNVRSNTTPANSQSITVSGKVSGGGGLTLNGNNAAGNGGGNGGNKFLALTNTTNDYSGTFHVLNAQILRSAPATTGDTLGTGTVDLSGGILQVRDAGTGSGGTIAYGNDVTVGTGGGIVDVDRTGATNTGNTVALGDLTIGAQTLTTTGANGYGVRFDAGTLTGAAVLNTTVTTTLGGVAGAGFSLTKTGAGKLNLGGAQNYDTLNANVGVTNLNGELGTGGSTLNASATVNINASQTLGALNIAGGVTVTVNDTPQFAGPPESPGAPAPVPEPGTLGLLMVGALGLLSRKRRVVA